MSLILLPLFYVSDLPVEDRKIQYRGEYQPPIVDPCHSVVVEFGEGAEVNVELVAHIRIHNLWSGSGITHANHSFP